MITTKVAICIGIGSFVLGEICGVFILTLLSVNKLKENE